MRSSPSGCLRRCQLAAFAFVLSILVSIPLGVLSATRPNSAVDHAATVLALVGQSIPSFWLGILLILFFGVHLRWLPISGSGTWQHLIMPGSRLPRSRSLATCG